MVNWADVEKKWQDNWESDRIFEPKIDESKPKFYLTVPYPYVNAPLHIGHGRTYAIGDVIARYKRLKGYNVLWPMAFHLTGTPVLAVADRITAGDEKKIKQYIDYAALYVPKEEAEKVVKKFKDPKEIAEFFSSHIIQDFKSLGFSIDWRRKFNTGERVYQKFVEWQYHKLKEKGLLVKGEHPVLYSPADESAVGEDDIKDGDLNKVSVMEFTAIKFKFEDGYLVASTLRPETIFGITNLWINPDATYVKAKVGNEIWYISKEAAEKLMYQRDNVEVVDEVPGSYFIDKYIEILDFKVPILPANFVDPDNATGVVYSVPAHAPYDYIALYDLWKEGKYKEVQPITIIDIPGHSIPAKEVCEEMGIKDQTDERLEEATKTIYKEEFYKGVLNERCRQFAGMKINQIKDEVKVWMKENNLADVFYETSRKAVTRSGNKVIVAVLRDQWFIDYSSEEWKKKAHEWVDKMFIYPAKYRRMFHDTIDWLHQRPCARRRGLGTPLPFDKDWIIESLSDSTIYMAFYTIANKIREKDLEPSIEMLDYVFLGKGKPKPEWEELRKEFLYWYPNDLRHTAPAHISNHLTFFIMHHIAIFPEEAWPRGISLNEMLIMEGAKMSKSKGNVIPLAEISNRYTADLFRLYILSAADLDSVLDWREKDVSTVKKKLDEFREIIDSSIDVNPDTNNWLYHMFHSRLERADKLYNDLKFRDVIIELFFNVLNDIRKFKGIGDYKPAVKGIMRDWLIALSPIIPHTCEEYWNKIGSGYVSLQPWPTGAKVDETVVAKADYVERLISDVKNILKVSKENYSKLYVYTAPEWMYEVIEKLNAGQKLSDFIKSYDDKKAVAAFVKKAMKERLTNSFVKIDEVQALTEMKDHIEKDTGLELHINDSYDPMNKRRFAIPGKPGVYLE